MVFVIEWGTIGFFGWLHVELLYGFEWDDLPALLAAILLGPLTWI